MGNRREQVKLSGNTDVMLLPDCRIWGRQTGSCGQARDRGPGARHLLRRDIKFLLNGFDLLKL